VWKVFPEQREAVLRRATYISSVADAAMHAIGSDAVCLITPAIYNDEQKLLNCGGVEMEGMPETYCIKQLLPSNGSGSLLP
jgi:hypothetical protein